MAGFGDVERVGALLRDLPCAWYVCGGWAIDLFLGRVTRGHKDVMSNRREEYEADFRNALARLGRERRAWLKGALVKLHAAHPWAHSL